MGEKGNVADVQHVGGHVPAATKSAGGMMHDAVKEVETHQGGGGSDSGMMHDVVRGTTDAAAHGAGGAASGIVGKKDDDESDEV